MTSISREVFLEKNLLTLKYFLYPAVYLLIMEEAMAIPNGMTANEKLNITRVINEYSKRLLGFIRKRVNNEADAEDILQDVFPIYR